MNDSLPQSNSISNISSIYPNSKSTIYFKYQNINGIGDKLGQIDILNDILQRDIIVYSEAMKGSNFVYDLPGYSVEMYPHSTHNKCKRRVPGGFLLIVKNAIKKKVKVVKQNDHVLWLCLNNLVDSIECKIFIGAVYIPHEKSVLRDLERDEITSIQKDIERFSQQGIIYPIGDWNARTGNLLDFIKTKNMVNLPLHVGEKTGGPRRLNIDQTVNAHGRKLIDLCKSTGHAIQNGRINEQSNVFTCYRHNGQSTVDYLLSKNDQSHLIKNFEVQPRTIDSDHCALTFSLPAKQGKSNEAQASNQEVKREIPRYKWDKTKTKKYHDNLSNKSSKLRSDEFVASVGSRDLEHHEVIDKFYDFLMPSVKETFKTVSNNRNKKFPVNDWFDQDCKSLKRKVNDMLKIDPWSTEADILKKEYHRVRQNKKRAKKRQISKKAHNLKANRPQDFWDFWKTQAKKKRGGNVDIDVTKFTEYYKNVQNNHLTANDENYNQDYMRNIEKVISEIDMEQEINMYIDNPIFDALNGPIQIEEIEKALKKSKNKKAAGSDGLVSEFIKYSDGHIDGPLSVLFNFILNSGEYPDIWSEGLVNPIHKKESKTDPGNYRKVTVLPALGKLFDIILNARLTSMKEMMESYDRLQFGFREKHGAVDNAFILDSIIDINKARGRPTYVCYIDLKSAFDMIIRAALLWKLRKQGIKGKFFAVISSMFKKAQSTVKWAGEIGETFNNLCGVLQGGVSSPQLFKIFLEDLVKYLDKSCGIQINTETICHLLLADDLALISETKSGLQKLLDGFSAFCKQWHLVVNMDKTKYSVFNKELAFKTRKIPLLYKGEEVNETDDYVYVGINFSTKKDRFAKHFDNKVDSANRAIFAAMSLARDACGGELSALMHLHIFDTQIRPILEYASPVWFKNKQIDALEHIQTKFLRRTLGVGRSTPNLALYGDTNKCPLLIRQQYMFLKYWARLTQMPEGSVMHNIYKEHQKLNTPFMEKVKGTLESAGVLPGNLPIVKKKDNLFFLRHMRHNLEFLYKEKWFAEINDSEKNPMLRLYKKFKKSFGLEAYIKHVADRKIQKSISQFRLSSHCLRIHKGRQERDKNGKNTPANKRFCLSCKNGNIDDELHLLNECKTHSNERKLLISRIAPFIDPHRPHTLIEVLSNILNSDNEFVLYEFGKFLKNSFNKRKSENK